MIEHRHAASNPALEQLAAETEALGLSDPYVTARDFTRARILAHVIPAYAARFPDQIEHAVDVVLQMGSTPTCTIGSPT